MIELNDEGFFGFDLVGGWLFRHVWVGIYNPLRWYFQQRYI
jgi:hypothetical protein